MHTLSVLVLFLSLSFFICNSCSYKNDNKVIYDITRIIGNAMKTRPIQDIFNTILSVNLSSNFIYYWEADLQNKDSVDLQEFLQALKKYQSAMNSTSTMKPNILISIKGTVSNWSYVKETLVIHKAQGSSDHIPMVSGISLELPDYCETSVNLKAASFAAFIKSWRKSGLHESSTAKLSVGCTINFYDLLQCNIHSEILQSSDYLVIVVPLFRNHHTFVESYGIFSKQMNEIKTAVSRKVFELIGISDLEIYYKVTLSTKMSTKMHSVCITNNLYSSKYRYNEPSCGEIMKSFDFKEIQNENEIVRSRYAKLLEKYLFEWVAHLNDSETVGIIQAYQNISPKTSCDSEYWLNTNMGIVPYLSNLPLEGTTSVSMMSIGLLFKSVVTSGFETIMISREKWTALENEISIFLETEFDNFTKNLLTQPIYMVDEVDPLNINRISDVTNSQTYIFSFAIKTSLNETVMQNASSALKKLFLKDRNHLTNINSNEISEVPSKVWEKFYDVFFDYNGTHYLTTRILPVYPFYSNVKNKSFLIWRATIILNNNTKTNWLNNLVLIRKILSKEYSFQQIILHVKVSYIDISKERRSSIYCSNLQAKFSLFYETLFTWAQLNDFPLILEPFNNHRDFGNPLVWEPLTKKGNRKLKQVIKAVPTFVRRRYNQSRIFGRWLEGTYPCITKSSSSSIQFLQFDKEFIGVNLNLNWLSETTALEERELTTILLLVLKEFGNVQVLLDDKNLELLTRTVISPGFSRSLTINGIDGNKLYLRVSNLTQNIRRNLSTMTSVLKANNIGIILMPHILIDANDNTRIKDYDQRGVFHPFCNIMAHRIVFERNKLYDGLKQIKYLICETDAFPASNSDEEKMKSYLDSHLYLTKLFQHYYPNIQEIHFYLKPTIVGDSWRQQAQNLLMFLSDLNSYAKDYRIYYFLLPAFTQENSSDLTMGFWSITNYTNLKDPSVFESSHSKYFGNPTWIPKVLQEDFDEESRESFVQKVHKTHIFNGDWYSTEVAFGTFSLIFVSTLFVMIVAWNCWRKKQGLSTNEVKEFFNGRQRTLEDAVNGNRRNSRFIGNIFDGLVYQKEYERLRSAVDLSEKSVISKGRFASVYLATFHGSDKKVVIKIPKRNCSKDAFKGFLSEVKLLCYLGDHINIVSFIGCHTKDIQNRVLWIITEYCEMGTLSSYLNEIRNSDTHQWSVQQLIVFAAEIASGMSHIVNQNVIHGGLSAKHILLSRDLTCKISGFSLSRNISEYEKHVMNNQYEKLPWRWMAPESLEKLEFSKQSDLWCYGVTLWEIFSLGELPYSEVTLTPEFIINIEKDMRLNSPPYATNEIFKVMLKCWKREPHERPEFFNVQEYFSGLTLRGGESGWGSTTSL